MQHFKMTEYSTIIYHKVWEYACNRTKLFIWLPRICSIPYITFRYILEFICFGFNPW